MECPKCKQFNAVVPQCVRCGTTMQPLNISQRVAEALRVVTGDFEFMYDCERERGSGAKEPIKPNVLYVGHDEYYELARDRLHSMPDAQHGVLFMGLRVLRVDLASWLQVAHVDGSF